MMLCPYHLVGLCNFYELVGFSTNIFDNAKIVTWSCEDVCNFSIVKDNEIPCT